MTQEHYTSTVRNLAILPESPGFKDQIQANSSKMFIPNHDLFQNTLQCPHMPKTELLYFP